MKQSSDQGVSETGPLVVERVQLGVRMEKRMVKVLKALAEYLDLSLGDLLEGMVLHTFENKPPFSPTTLQRIEQLKEVYGMKYDARMSHHLAEDTQPPDLAEPTQQPSSRSAEGEH